MKRWLAVGVVALLLAVPAASASWPQISSDAARTGHADVDGPRTNDTAFEVRMPGGLSTVGFLGPPEPLVIGDDAYVPVRPTPEDDGLDAQGIVRVNLDTAETELLVETNRTPQYLASADGRIYAIRDRGLDAYDAATGEQLWSIEHPTQPGTHEQTFCQAPAVARGLVYASCTELTTAGGDDDVEQNPPRLHPFLWFVNATTGEHVATTPLVPDEDSGEVESALEDPESSASESRASPQRFAVGVSVAGERAYAFTFHTISDGACNFPTDDSCVFAGSTSVRLWALDADSFDVQWSNVTQWRESRVNAPGPAGPYRPANQPDPPLSARVTATDRVAYPKFDGEVQARSAADGSILGRDELGASDLEENVGGMSSALVDGVLYTTSAQTLYRFDEDVQVNTWQFALDPAFEEEFSWGTVTATDDTVYIMAHEYGDQSALYAVGADDGEQVFRYEVQPVSDDYRDFSFIPFSYALADGAMVIAGYDGTFRAIGETGASLGDPEVDASTTYPEPGENMTVDLSGTPPGAQGNATLFRADWGDGNTTDWQKDPELSHAYEQPGNVTARFFAANEANQSSRTTETFHVGQSPPEEPSFVAEQFQNHPDRTYGLLGLAVALGGGAIGVGRRYRKRSLLERELEALEQGFEETRDQPSECEAFLDNRKARARSLALDGKLDEEQVTVIENRAEELRSKLRTEALEDQFGFLPHSLVVKARQMVEDGQVTGLERDAFLRAVEEDEMLTSQQKTQVRERIEQWFARDAGGGAG